MNNRNPNAVILAAAFALIASTSLSAQEASIPRTFFADDAGQAATGPDASSSASIPAPASRFLGFESKEAFHRFSGWMAGGTLLAAGIVGGVHALGMMSEAHDWRDAHGIESDDYISNEILRDAVSHFHLWLGAIAPALLLWHIVSGQRAAGCKCLRLCIDSGHEGRLV